MSYFQTNRILRKRKKLKNWIWHRITLFILLEYWLSDGFGNHWIEVFVDDQVGWKNNIDAFVNYWPCAGRFFDSKKLNMFISRDFIIIVRLVPENITFIIKSLYHLKSIMFINASNISSPVWLKLFKSEIHISLFQKCIIDSK